MLEANGTFSMVWHTHVCYLVMVAMYNSYRYPDQDIIYLKVDSVKCPA